ncbi:MAG: hypothetical protein D6719_00770 [Candidatus Dadabacteria bacterium]|nr:MAG: hypothetical protein D6719_00770 [Candidatus Dadabacteria bacterium]
MPANYKHVHNDRNRRPKALLRLGALLALMVINSVEMPKNKNYIRPLLFIGILGLAVYLRVHSLNRGVWYDEYSSLQLAQAADFWSASKNYDHPPLFFYLLRHWSSFNHVTWFLRLLSVVFSVASVIVFALWLRLLLPEASIWGALLAATSPGLLFFSQEIRQYSLLTFCCLTAVFFLEKSLQSEERKLKFNLFLFSLFLVLAVSTHLVAVFLLPGVLAYCLADRERIKRSLFVKIVFCEIWPALAFIYYYYFHLMAWQYGSSASWWMPKPGPQLILSNLIEFTGLPQMASGVSAMPHILHSAGRLLFFVALGFLVWSGSYGNIRLVKKPLCLFLGAYIPLVLYSYFFTPVLTSRTTLFMLPFVLAVIALMLASIESQKIKAVAAFSLSYFCMLAALNWVILEAPYERVPWTGLTEAFLNSVKQDSPEKFIISGYPHDTRTMLMYKTNRQFQKNMIPPEEFQCKIFADRSLYFLLQQRRFLTDRELKDSSDFMQRFSDCYDNKELIFNKRGLKLYKFH